MNKCCVEGCDNKRDGRSKMCGKHRRRMRLYGDPLTTKNRPPRTGFTALGYKATQINGQKKFDHVRIAESVLGRELPNGAVVHHADGIRSNNVNSNLVICPSRAYHNLLHARIDAMKATGDPDKRKCRTCGKYDTVENMTVYVSKTGSISYWHKKGTSRQSRQVMMEIFMSKDKQSEIANKYGITQSAVSRIKARLKKEINHG